MKQGTCYKFNKFCNLEQLWYVIISMIIILTAPKLQHTKKPGPGPPLKSEDITGWGLKVKGANI